MGRILGIDYGTQRTGLAATDNLQIAAHGLTALPTSEVMPYLVDYFSRETIDRIVIGVPLKPGKAFEQGLKRFVSELHKRFPELAVSYEQEDFTSQEARRVIRQAYGTHKKKHWDKSLVDKVSAVMILQRHLGHI